MEQNTGCASENIGKTLPENNKPGMTMTDEKPYILPTWRICEIMLQVLEILSSVEYYNEDFDYKKMIQDKGIKLRKFSSFMPDNLKQLKTVSLSIWNEGICVAFPDVEANVQRRMIAYNDSKTEFECMLIILHEFGHLQMHHTQQSINGEVEASCFAMTMSFFLMLEEQFHLGRTVVRQSGKQFFVQRIKDAINKRS